MKRHRTNPVIPFLVLLASVALAGCETLGMGGVKGELSDETKAQLSPQMERWILLADIEVWTGAARVYAEKEFCPEISVPGCADKDVVIALSKVLERIKPAVESLKVTASGDDLTTYLSLATTLLLQLQTELVQAALIPGGN